MTLTEQQLQQAAEQIRRARSQPPVRIGHLATDSRPADVTDAMAIQDRLNPCLTADGQGEVVGTKIGCTTQVMQEYLGMAHPCAGAIFASTVRSGDGKFSFDSFLHVGVECEIAVRLESAIASAVAPHTIESVSESVREFLPAIEVVDDRYVDFANGEPDWRTWLADNFFGAGISLGEPVGNWQELDLAAIRGVMRINGKEVGSGYGRDIINGHPLEALVWLANFEAARGRDLPAGWIVMLGSIVQTKWVAEGDVVDVEIEGLGRARADFL